MKINERTAAGKDFSKLLASPAHLISLLYTASIFLFPRGYFIDHRNIFWVYTISAVSVIAIILIYNFLNHFRELKRYFDAFNRIDDTSGMTLFMVRGVLFIIIVFVSYYYLVNYCANAINIIDEILLNENRFFLLWRVSFGLSAGLLCFFFFHVWTIYFTLKLYDVFRSKNIL